MEIDFLKVWNILNAAEKRQLSSVAGLQLFSALMDMFGVISVFPFLSYISTPSGSSANSMLAGIKDYTQLSDTQFLVALGLFSLVVLVLNQITRIGSGWYSQLIFHKIWLAIEMRMFKYFLSRPYKYHLKHSSKSILEKLQIQVNAAAAGVINPTFLMISSFFGTSFLVLLLILAEPKITILLMCILLLFYWSVYQKSKGKMDYYGKIGPEYSARAFHLILEAFGSIKEIKLAGNEKTYLDLFEPTAKRWADAEVKKIFFMITPAGIVEVFAFGGIILVSMLMIVSAEGLQEIVPLLGIYALSLRRIIPAIQNIYLQISEIKYYKPSFDKIYPDLVSSLTLDKKNSNSLDNKSGNIFFKKIEIINLSFSYPESPKKIINSVSTNIDAGSIIGIAGESGAGKTTFIDLVLGVFEACDGSILLDGRPTRGELLRGWQKNIGYVPQLGFISDSSIAKNIAFGIPEEEIDIDRVKKVSAIAQISEFIESELPMQYETLVGEGGSSLSGGQRQRIRIARALYNNPNVLIFDEATSALDGIVEERILESIRNFGGGKTIFLISHRLSTLKECDKILFFEKGELIDEGTFEHLISNNSSFKIMAKESENHSSF